MKKFRLVIGCDVVLKTKELWPDGDAPENPTVEEVEDLIHSCGGIPCILHDWDLDRDLEIQIIDLGE